MNEYLHDIVFQGIWSPLKRNVFFFFLKKTINHFFLAFCAESVISAIHKTLGTTFKGIHY